MNKAVFLDRDGVINEKRDDYVKNLDELKILPCASKAIKKLNELGYLVIIITNQSAVNRKIISLSDLKKINDFIVSTLQDDGAKIDAIYYCPHSPTENCFCRKPQPGLILKAIEEFVIDPSKSVLIGDDESDMEAAKRAEIIGLQIKTNGNLLEFINTQLHIT